MDKHAQTERPWWILLFLGVLCLSMMGCTQVNPQSTFEELLKVRPPESVKITNFSADILFLDPSFAWELSPIDEALLKSLIEKNQLKTSSVGETIPASGTTWKLSWWDQKRLDSLPEAYFDDSSNGLRIWVDRTKNRLYIEFAGR